MWHAWTGTLLSGDCLQMYGLFGSGKWGANISMPLEYLAAIEKLRTMDLKTLAASHDYHPYGYLAQGEKEIGRYLNACVDALHGIKKRICENPSLSDEELAELYNSSGNLPTVGAHVFAAIREDMI